MRSADDLFNHHSLFVPFDLSQLEKKPSVHNIRAAMSEVQEEEMLNALET